MQDGRKEGSSQAREQSDRLIATAIADAEARSATEIAVAILPRAEPYRLTAVLAAVTLFAVLDMLLRWSYSIIAGWIDPVIGAGAAGWLGPSAAIVVAILFFILCEHTRLGVVLTPPGLRRQACLARSRLLFLGHGVDATEDRLGLLICVCEAERHIEILPDRGIAAVIPPERWAARSGRNSIRIARPTSATTSPTRRRRRTSRRRKRPRRPNPRPRPSTRTASR